MKVDRSAITDQTDKFSMFFELAVEYARYSIFSGPRVLLERIQERNAYAAQLAVCDGSVAFIIGNRPADIPSEITDGWIQNRLAPILAETMASHASGERALAILYAAGRRSVSKRCLRYLIDECNPTVLLTMLATGFHLPYLPRRKRTGDYAKVRADLILNPNFKRPVSDETLAVEFRYASREMQQDAKDIFRAEILKRIQHAKTLTSAFEGLAFDKLIGDTLLAKRLALPANWSARRTRIRQRSAPQL